MALNTPGGDNELHRAALAGNGLARVYAGVVQQLLADTGVAAEAVTRHRRARPDGAASAAANSTTSATRCRSTTLR